MSGSDRIRVLVVDDSVIARRFITRRLEKDPELDVIGTASSGTTGLERIRRDPPDVVILDEEMPDMRGRDVLKVIRKEHPTVAVVMFSGHVSHGTQARFEALLLGADDAVAKPKAADGPVSDDHPTWAELLAKTKHAARRPDRGGVHVDVARRVSEQARDDSPDGPAPTRPGTSAADRASSAAGPRQRPTTPSASTPESLRRASGTAPRPSSIKAKPRPVGAARRQPTTGDAGVVVIASSTGGPDALTVLFGMLPHDFPLPILVVQHMPPHFTKLLAQRLDRVSPLQVVEAAGGELLEPGVAYVAPGDNHLVVVGAAVGCTTDLSQAPPENSCRPAADVLWRSAVEVFGYRTVGCVISGMGQDGMLGAVAVHEAGGTVVVQDEETSVVWGMPGATVEAGVAHKVLALESIAAELTLSARTIATRFGKRQEVRS